MEQQTLSLPSLLLLLLLTAFLLRYFFFSSRTPTAQNSFPATQGRGARTPDTRLVDQVAQMFPQLSRREVAWDLQRNGGSVAATTERVLGGRGLDVPPLPTSPSSPSTSFSSQSKPAHPDLITRYNLAAKLTQDPGESSRGKQGWSQNKNERQALLQRRREEMILSARRKMEERERVGGRVGGT